MGVVYAPVDQPGIIVNVQADLQDYYYELNTDDVPSLYFNTSDLSANNTNDSYNPWKTK